MSSKSVTLLLMWLFFKFCFICKVILLRSSKLILGPLPYPLCSLLPDYSPIYFSSFLLWTDLVLSVFSLSSWMVPISIYLHKPEIWVILKSYSLTPLFNFSWVLTVLLPNCTLKPSISFQHTCTLVMTFCLVYCMAYCLYLFWLSLNLLPMLHPEQSFKSTYLIMSSFEALPPFLPLPIELILQISIKGVTYSLFIQSRTTFFMWLYITVYFKAFGMVLFD